MKAESSRLLASQVAELVKSALVNSHARSEDGARIAAVNRAPSQPLDLVAGLVYLDVWVIAGDVVLRASLGIGEVRQVGEDGAFVHPATAELSAAELRRG